MSQSDQRLAIILSHPVQYYSPWFQWMAAHTNVTFRVFYLWEFGVTARHDPQFGKTILWDIDLLSGYDSEFVPNVSPDPGTHHFAGLDNPELPARLAAWRPTALLMFGYNWKSHLRALWWARWHRVPLILRGDSHWLGRGAPAWHRRAALNVLFRQFAAFLNVGTANADYYRTLGVPMEKLFLAPHSVDASRFDPADSNSQAAAARLRTELGLTGKRIVLFAGKLHERKQPVELLEAFLAVATDEHALIFVGDGAEHENLLQRAARAPDHHVRFLPFANQSEMPARYLLGDLMALPSRGYYETWGLAVNEAMHLGRPCLVSDLVGCQRDLVIPHRTGWVFSANDSADLRRTLHDALHCPSATLAEFSRNCLSQISGFTYVHTTQGLTDALAQLR